MQHHLYDGTINDCVESDSLDGDQDAFGRGSSFVFFTFYDSWFVYTSSNLL